MIEKGTEIMTEHDLIAISDNSHLYELNRGVIEVREPAGARHGLLGVAIVAHLQTYVREHHLGNVFGPDTGFKLTTDPDTIRAPDVAFVSERRLAATPVGAGFYPEAPDLAIEVISPGDHYAEVIARVTEFLAAGTRLIIVVNPDPVSAISYLRSGEVRAVGPDGHLDGGSVVPGWRLPMQELLFGG